MGDSLEYVKGKIADLEDDLQHYTMVEKDKCKEFYIREDLKVFKGIEQDLTELKAIKETKPSEVLEELNVIEENLTCELRKLNKIGDKELAIEIAVGLADKFEKAIKPIKQALTGLKDVKEANPSEALKEFEEFKNILLENVVILDTDLQRFNIIKQALIEGQKDKQELAKYKALKITNLLIKGK